MVRVKHQCLKIEQDEEVVVVVMEEGWWWWIHRSSSELTGIEGRSVEEHPS